MPSPALAVEMVKSPIVNEGALQLEDKGKYQFDSNPAKDNDKEYDLGVNYGVTGRWKTKLESEFEDKPSDEFHYKLMRWENIISLTGNNDELPTALYFEAVASNRANLSHYVMSGVILQKNIEQTTNLANLFIRKEVGDTASDKLSYVYRFQSRYHLDPHFDPGFEIYGDTNKQSVLDKESLKIGPAAFGKFGFDWAPNFGYEVVLLFGATPATQTGTLKWKLTYDF